MGQYSTLKNDPFVINVDKEVCLPKGDYILRILYLLSFILQFNSEEQDRSTFNINIWEILKKCPNSCNWVLSFRRKHLIRTGNGFIKLSIMLWTIGILQKE